MNALLIIAHGSRNAESIREIQDLTCRLKNATDQFDLVECAFLEMAEPDIATGLTGLIKKGAKEIVALPYFLAKGNHVIRDVPDEISGAQCQHPDIEIRLLPHIGKSTGMADLITEHVKVNKRIRMNN